MTAKEPPMKTAILCRTNSPLVKCAFDLVRRGRKVRLVGRDIAKKLTDLIGEILEHRTNCPVAEFLNLLDSYIEHIKNAFKDREDMESFVSEQQDYAGCLNVISLQCSDAMGVINTIQEYFVDTDNIDDLDDDVIVLASGHRSKGLQWPRVIILRPDLVPHPAAFRKDDIQQEEHLWYVMLTRVEHQDRHGREGELIICSGQEP